MDINYLGHSSFRIKSKNTALVLDPFDSKKVGLKFPSVEADFVTVSHNHDDHNYVSAVKGFRKVIDGPGEYEINDISVIGLPSFHDDKEGQIRGKNVIYVIETEGMRLCHLGDLGHTLSEKAIEDIGEIQILFVPVGGEYTIGPEQAVEVVNDIEPKIIIPMHYKVSGLALSKAAEMHPVEDFLTNISVTVEKLPKLSVKANDIGEEQKVVLLESKA